MSQRFLESSLCSKFVDGIMDFVDKQSIVRKIWGDADVVLFIFAGAAAEFSLNKAVDWLYFTGKLPKDPLGRLFSTVTYAQKIVFSELSAANSAIDQIVSIHKNVEKSRQSQIPDWAYRDVLFMLIYYSIQSFQALERKLTLTEKEEVFLTFLAVGERMQISGLPKNFEQWEIMHNKQLDEDLIYSKFSADLFVQYRKNLGLFRFSLLKRIQGLIAPQHVKQLLKLGNGKSIVPILLVYKAFKALKLHRFVRNMLLPAQYKSEILNLEMIDKTINLPG